MASTPLRKKVHEERGKARELAIEKIHAGKKGTPGSLFVSPALPEIQEEWRFGKSLEEVPRVLMAYEVDSGDSYPNVSMNHLFIPAHVRLMCVYFVLAKDRLSRSGKILCREGSQAASERAKKNVSC